MAIALSSHACDMAVAGAQAPPPFIDALYERIDRDGHLPEFARLEITPPSVGRPSFAFGNAGHVVLRMNLYGYPDPKGTAALVAPLIDAASGTAARYALALTGIEIVFHRRQRDNPMQVWAATPPWGAEQIFRTPLSTELIETMKPPRE